MLMVSLFLVILAFVAMLPRSLQQNRPFELVGLHESARARYLAEAGVSIARAQLSDAQCDSYRDVGGSLGSGSSYTAAFDTDAGSPVTISGLGNVGLSQRSFISTQLVYDAAQVYELTITGTDAVSDTHVESGRPDDVFGTANDVKINPNGKHALLWFSLGDLPSYVQIVSASLVFFPTAAGNSSEHMTVSAYRVTSPWSEDSASWKASGYGDWASPGGDVFAVPVNSTLVTDKNQEYQLEVGRLVADWYSGAVDNVGLLLAVTSGPSEVRFVSHDYGSGQPASLVVRYTCVCGVPCGSAGAVEVERVAFTVLDEVWIDGVAYANEDVIAWDPLTGATTKLLDGSARSMSDTAINSLDILGPNEYVLSFSSSIRLAWQQLEPDDAIAYYPSYSAVSKRLSGDSTFLADEDIDALSYLPNGRVLLSTAGPATIDGLNVADADLVEYDLESGTAVLVLSELALPVSGNADIDGVQALADGRLVVSFAEDVLLNGKGVSDGDMVLYDPRTQSVQLTFSEDDTFETGGDIKGVFDNRSHLQTGLVRLSSTQGTYIDQAVKDANFANESHMRLGASEMMLIEFEFSELPEGASVTSAKLYLALASPPSTPAALVISSVSNLWAAEDVTWSTFQESNSAVALGFFTAQPLAGSWAEVNVPPALVHEWVDGVRTNAGFALSAFLGWTGSFSVHGRESSTRILRPQLIIEYTTP